MNMTEFWYKLVDMAKSDAKIVSLGGISLTEKQLLWLIGIFTLIILILLLRSATLWIFRPATAPKGQSKVNEPVAENRKVDEVPTAIASASKESAPAETAEPKTVTPHETPQTLLTDTSDKKRSMHDYVTPDSVSADVAKKSLTNDYPYETLKPDPTKVGQIPVVPPTTSIDAPQVKAPVTEPTPAVAETVATSTVQPIASPTVSPVTIQEPIAATQPIPIAEIAKPVQEAKTESLVVKPANVATPEPSVSMPELELPVVPVAAKPVEPTETVIVPSVTTANTSISATTTVTPSTTILPPLPPKEPTSHMVVGVADESAQPIKRTTFNPADPVLP